MSKDMFDLKITQEMMGSPSKNTRSQKGTQYRSTKIQLKSVRPFQYLEVVLKDVADVNPNDQTSVLEHLDKVVRNMIDKCGRMPVSRPELKLPLIRIKVDYSGFMTINPQRFGQKYVGKVANPQDILIFSKSAKKRQTVDEKDEVERLRPEELNQQNIEALVAESKLKMEILPVNDVDIALQDFVNKDDKLAFYSCLQYNLNEIRNRLSKESEALKIEDDNLILRVEKCLQERVKERSLLSKENARGVSGSQILEKRDKNIVGPGSSNAFSDEEHTSQIPFSAKSRNDSRTGSVYGNSGSTRGRSRGRGRGSRGLKQTTLEATMRTCHSERSASASASATLHSLGDDGAESLSSGESEYERNDAVDDSEPEESLPSRGRKRNAPRGRGRGSASSTKRTKKTDKPSVQTMLMSIDDDEDDVQTRLQRSQPKVARDYGAVRKR